MDRSLDEILAERQQVRIFPLSPGVLLPANPPPRIREVALVTTEAAAVGDAKRGITPGMALERYAYHPWFFVFSHLATDALTPQPPQQVEYSPLPL